MMRRLVVNGWFRPRPFLGLHRAFSTVHRPKMDGKRLQIPPMEGDESVLVEDGGYFNAPSVLRFTLNRPDKRNALSVEALETMEGYLSMLNNCSTQFRVVLIQGAGDVFCSGHDLKEMMAEENNTLETHRELFSLCSRVMLLLQEIPQPVITAVHGVATAAGCQMVAASDLTISTPSAKFATPGVTIGLFCSTPAVPLVRCIGRKAAMDMLLTGRMIEAEEALAIGLVTEVTEGSDSLEEAQLVVHQLGLERAKSIAQFSGPCLGIGKRTITQQIDLDLKSAYEVASKNMAENMVTHDANEGIQAFLGKRTPQWEHK